MATAGVPDPAIDGNGEDIIALAGAVGDAGCGIDIADPRDDISISDDGIIPCSTLETTNGGTSADYYVNGKDLRRFVAVYRPGDDALFLLFRAEGFIGDVDGNENPDNANCTAPGAPPTASFVDQVGIGSEDSYEAFIDTNCDGDTDFLIVVKNNEVTVNGIVDPTATFAYRANAGLGASGRDLEVRINGLVLSPGFTIFGFSGAIRDGLGEDVTGDGACPVNPDIALDKSVNVASICPGGSADFTLLVTNTGDVDLTNVTVVDNLPPGLVYQQTASNTCGGPVSPVGNTITYGPFELARGASCTIVIRVGRTAECSGEQVNNAVVEGTFQSDCIDNGEPIIVTDNDSAALLCGSLTCLIDAPDTGVCGTEMVQICGPEGNYSYAWSNQATTRCIMVGVGTYSLVITDLTTGCRSTNPCEVRIVEEPCVENCPRTVGFWGAQCAQRDNGSQKFTREQLTQIAQCIDDRSAFFNWEGTTDFDMFCRALSTSNMTIRVQAKRQFAGVLANLCSDALNLQPMRGGEIYLDPTTPIRCSGLEADTIGELIDEVDAILAELEGMSLNDAAVKSRYGQLVYCLDGINNGMNIPVSVDCEHGETMPTGDATEFGDNGSVDLYRPIPNPFTGATAFAYKVDATDAAVDITVYDVAGRQIRKLVSGVQAAGQYTASWDGRNDAGAKVNRGVYFVRTIIAGAKANTNRVMYLSQ